MISNLSSKESGCGCGGGGSASAAPCSCGGAGCGSCVAQGIVRPRFFAGQLLTEDDLQLLSDYVGQKNRLHNRHLFGAGVVCGLEVTCDPCGDGRVIVQPGYAIDCCGNDLTLSCPQVVDLNALVRKLRKNDCVDPCPDIKKLKGRTEAEDDEDDDDTDKEKPNSRYCLYIRYCEQPSDPVTPYSTGEECVQLGCEPTRIREGVTFELRCVDPHMAGSPLLERLCLSLGDLDKFATVLEAFQTLGKGSKTLVLEKKRVTVRRKFLRGELDLAGFEGGSEFGRVDDRSRLVGVSHTLLRDTREAFKIVRNWLIERLSKSTFITDCTLKQRVYDLVLPASDTPENVDVPAAADSSKELVAMFIDYLRTSVCRVLNPACLPCEDSAVLLACLDWEECEVKRICNMERTYVLSPAAVRYWLPPLQLAGNLVERLCCVAWEDLAQESSPPDEQDLGQILKEELKNELKRLIKDSFCGVSDRTFDHTLARLEQLFRNGSNEAESFDLRNDFVEPAAQPTTRSTTFAQPVSESAVTSTTPAPARKASPRKTGMKAARKGATKTASKASAAATETSNTTAPAKATETATTGGPAAAGTTTSAPAPTATTPKGEEK